jgi:3-hydroxyisobutyrate dehydrogenase-like beta-hydroxyacid dehydrogenase
MKPTIAIIAQGAMGSAVARRLTRNGVTVLTSLEGRGARSRDRAQAAGMQDVDDQRLVNEASMILSIVPPADAPALASRFAAKLGAATHAPLFADCNAIAVSTVIDIGRGIARAGGRFVDGGIIGGPPKEDDRGPTIYVSGEAASEVAKLSAYGLHVRLIDGPVGAASALKLSYAGISKGLVAIATTMILAAERAGAGPALKAELASSQPQLLARFAKSVPDMYPKAYRWVEEMHAIAEFIGNDVPESAMFEGAAGLYQRLAEDVAGDRALCKRLDGFFFE